MWFATGKGLCRYDGTIFKLFTAEFQTSKSGSCIQEDGFGRIWYANFDGFLYYVEKGVLKALPQETSLGYFKYGILNNELYLIQPNAVHIYDLKTLKIKSKINIANKIIKLCYTTSTAFYVLGDFLYEIKSAQQVKKHAIPIEFNDRMNGPIANDWNSKLLICTKDNKDFYLFENGKFKRSDLKINTNFIQNTSISNNEIWICTPNGVIKKDLYSNTKTTYFQDQNISYVFKDKYNNYWISTLNKGLLFIENLDNNYLMIQPRPISLSQAKNDVYVGAESDLLFKINKETLQSTTIFATKNNHTVNQIYNDTVSEKVFFNSYIFRILDKNYAIEKEFAIAIKDIKKVDDKYFSFAASGISGIFSVNPNLVSDWDLLFNKNKIEEFSGFNQSGLINSNNGKSTEYLSNTIYYSTNNGLLAVTKDGLIKEIKYQDKTLFLVKIQKYGNQLIGLSTAEKLYLISSDHKVSEFPLPSVIAKVKFTKFFIQKNYCYLLCSNAIYEYDFLTKKVQKIISLRNDFEATDVILVGTKLWLATSKGIVIKDRTIPENYSNPKLIIDEISIDGIRKEVGALENLKPDENDITIRFSTLSSIPNENFPVYYKINQNNWMMLDASSKNLKLSALSPGKYTVQLAINFNSKKIDLQQVTFTIHKPFWLTNLFLALLFLLIVALFYFFYNYQIKKIELKNKLILEKNELENNLTKSTLKAIKSQMNPHFFYNALNTIQSYILANDKKQAVNYLSKFSLLTRNILEMSEKEFISLEEEILTISLYLEIEKARFNEDFEYEIIKQNISNFDEKIPSMLLQPYIENAVKHGLLHKSGSKKLILIFSKEADVLTIEIDDNGVGRQKSMELNAIKNKHHQSFATNAMQNRIDLLNKNKINKISIEFVDKLNQSKQSLGTKVIIKIPLKQ
jgi:sensor histidine kinase YesM